MVAGMEPTTEQIVAGLSLADKVRLVSGRDVWRTEAVTAPGLPHGVQSVMLSDGPHGLRKQEVSGDHLGVGGSRPATCFPTAVTLASSWDPDLLFAVGAAVGAEARSEQVAVVLGPATSSDTPIVGATSSTCRRIRFFPGSSLRRWCAVSSRLASGLV
jgi:beta-glucosidase-like glycosyl hydrolase